MPWTKFSLKNTLTNCTTGGGYTPPEATFYKAGCCYVADMAVDCSYEYLCQEYATQPKTISATLDLYQMKIPYITAGGTPSCPCVLTQRKEKTLTSTAVAAFFHRRKLKSIQVVVGKTSYDCGGGATCKFYIAINYFFDVWENTFDLCAGLEYQSVSHSCTGFYRDGTCSYTNSWTETNGLANCTDLMNHYNVFFDGESTSNPKFTACISRIKYYDALPGTDVTISNSDTVSTCAPVSCSVCNNADCFSALPSYSGPDAPIFTDVHCGCDAQCEPYDVGFTPEIENFEICPVGDTCPSVITGGAVLYSVPVMFCSTIVGYTCCAAYGDTCEAWGKDPDALSGCYFVRDTTTGEIIFVDYTGLSELIPNFDECLGGETPPPVSASCLVSPNPSDCEGGGKCKDCRATPCTYIFCHELSETSQISNFKYCRQDITSFTCTLGSITRKTAGNYCITTPTATLGFS